MARAETITQLPLDEWARIFGIHPLHFNGVKQPSNDPGGAICSKVWPQYAWQASDQVSREDIAVAISEAEAQVEEMLGYHLTPRWDYDEWQATMRAYRPELAVLNNGDVRGMHRIIVLGNSYFISGGIEAVLSLDEPAVVYSDADGDGYKETATATMSIAANYDPAEVEVHLTSAVGTYDEGTRIRPVRVHVTDNGNGTFTYVFTCRREQLVLWNKLSVLPSPTLLAVDGADDANFAATVEIWRHYNDPSTQAVLMWESAGDCSSCNGAGCGACLYATQSACLVARQDPKMSVVAYSPANWDAASQSFVPLNCWPIGRDPDVVRAYYRSGWTAGSGTGGRAPLAARPSESYPKMDPHWARIVAQFAASKLDREVCDCASSAQLDYWSQDLAYVGGATQLATFSISPSDLDNPFGTRRGAVMAWKAIQSPAVGKAVLI